MIHSTSFSPPTLTIIQSIRTIFSQPPIAADPPGKCRHFHLPFTLRSILDVAMIEGDLSYRSFIEKTKFSEPKKVKDSENFSHTIFFGFHSPWGLNLERPLEGSGI
jgi:hypothetical protein